MSIFDAIQQLFTPVPSAFPDLLPAPRVRAAAPPVRKEPGVYVEDEERRVFGFRMDKESDRKGATPNLTAMDVTILQERGFYGGKAVQAQNQTCKRMWHDGETVDGCAAQMRLSASWVEKRFACFSAALSEAGGWV